MREKLVKPNVQEDPAQLRSGELPWELYAGFQIKPRKEPWSKVMKTVSQEWTESVVVGQSGTTSIIQQAAPVDLSGYSRLGHTHVLGELSATGGLEDNVLTIRNGVWTANYLRLHD